MEKPISEGMENGSTSNDSLDPILLQGRRQWGTEPRGNKIQVSGMVTIHTEKRDENEIEDVGRLMELERSDTEERWERLGRHGSVLLD